MNFIESVPVSFCLSYGNDTPLTTYIYIYTIALTTYIYNCFGFCGALHCNGSLVIVLTFEIMIFTKK